MADRKSVTMTWTIALLMVAITAGCGERQDGIDAGDVGTDAGDSGTDAWEPPTVSHFWAETADFSVSGGIFDQVPAVFSRLSGYVTDIDGHKPPEPSLLGASGAGNGVVFALFGYGKPTNSMHSFAGPGYDIADGFFSDYALFLAPDGVVAEFDREQVARSLDAPVVITAGRLGKVSLYSIDFAPWFGPDSTTLGSEYLSRCMIRHIVVRNGGDADSPNLDLVVRAWGTIVSPSDGVMVEERETRKLVTRFVDGSGVVDSKKLIVPVGVMTPGQEKTLVLTHCAGPLEEAAELLAFDTAELLDETASQYQAWESTLADIHTPDPMVNDFIDGMKMSLKLQTSAQGATCPMSEYTRTWARDNMGPVLAMLALGGFEDVEGYLDYVYYAILKEGDLKNSYPATMEIDWNSVTVPDWESMPVLGDGSVGKKRVSAETPSYMVLMYGLHNRFTGKTDRIAQRRGLLNRCLFAQGFGPDNMLPFTGDETYRAAMNAAMGLNLEEPHEDLNWSGNSSALWLGAAREYQRFMRAAALVESSDAVVLNADADLAAERFVEVQDSTMNTFTLDDDCFAAFVTMSELTPSAPFDDVSLQVTWSGWRDGDDEYAQKAFKCLYDRFETVPGEICSPLNEMWVGIFPGVSKGIYTGMLPGYMLHSMTELGHPDAGAAFNMTRQTLSISGDVQEYMVLDNHAGLTLMYNTNGRVEPSDYTAKYRPWEGGIVLDAVMQYLFGFEPDANTRSIRLRPHLPNDWPTFSATGLRAADDRFDIEVQVTSLGHRVTVTSRGTGDDTWSLSLRWDLVGGSSFTGATVNGVAVDSGSVVTHDGGLFGQPSVEIRDQILSPGTPLVIEILE